MMEVEVGESPQEGPLPSNSRRPRRAAAEQAAKTIHVSEKIAKKIIWAQYSTMFGHDDW